MTKDAIAEQSLAATLRKLIEREIDLAFVKGETPQGEGGVALVGVSPSINIILSKAYPQYGTRIAYPTPVGGEIVRDDKALAIALAASLHGYTHYEAACVSELERRKTALEATGGNGNGNGAGGKSKLIIDP